ncbi:MAG: hypothetical protein AAFV07_21555, partial [Bacteroidota bacterium]
MKLTFVLWCSLVTNPLFATVDEGFETTGCPQYPFYNNCIPDWMPASGAPGIVDATFTAPYEGNQCAVMHIDK